MLLKNYLTILNTIISLLWSNKSPLFHYFKLHTRYIFYHQETWCINVNKFWYSKNIALTITNSRLERFSLTASVAHMAQGPTSHRPIFRKWERKRRCWRHEERDYDWENRLTEHRLYSTWRVCNLGELD